MSRQHKNNLRELKNHPYSGMVSSDWVAKNREILMMQVKNSAGFSPAAIKSTDPRFILILKRIARRYFSTQNPWAFAGRMALALLVAIVVPFTGWVTSVNAALLSVQGDTLYGLKIASEKVQISLSSSKQTEIKLRTEFASRRADEVIKLAARTGSDAAPHIKKTVERLSDEIKTVQLTLDEISAHSTPNAVVDAARNVDIKTDEITKVLNKTPAIARQVPEFQNMKTLVEEVSVKATETLVKTKHNDATVSVSNDELKQNIEDKIKNAQSQLNQVESTLTATTSTIAVVDPFSIQITIGAQVKNAKEVVAQATTSVQAENFEEALSKVKEIKILMNSSEKLIAQAAVATAITIESSTSTPKIIIPPNATTTNRNVSSTKEFIKKEGSLHTQAEESTDTIERLLHVPPTALSPSSTISSTDNQ